MNKQNVTIGFMLFALFFGAGNLIYPPTLGIDSGTNYGLAILGFILTGVGLPILTVLAVSTVKQDPRELADRVHPVFGLIFTSVVYLAIAPFFGIPRAATVAYEMSVTPFTEAPTSRSLFLFTAIFFAIVFWVSMNPSRMVDRIGQLLTPILLLAIVILGIGGIFFLKDPVQAPTAAYESSPFFTGFVEGYLTMDAIAALAFGIIVVQAFKDRGATTKQELITSTLKAGTITAVALITVYAAIGWIGVKLANQGPFDNGGDILSSASHMLFGSYGSLLLGIIVTLACFTTCVGLVVAAGQFFTKITGVPYKWIILVVTLGSFAIANQGLNRIIEFSVPVLVFIYPITIVLITLSLLHPLFGGAKAVYRGAILFTAIVSFYEGLTEFNGIELTAIKAWMERLPLFDIGLGWLIPACIGAIIGGLIAVIGNKKTTE
ncbi:branched-chain amino acid transport system II carrier protein [Ornithinibacillus gellani]|uniref:branched-chain amino acid transport system II carrier protein n=1 Tax=Ornithinibacillus gellani TaxID=2293253 RepID=UPI000F49C9F2|nr:branched-chain amino acid transport system II carrier protein [Ornithinibacillus gellani]TQS72091.1 branched-chain amino acid transport system II carrier protein [Ornithinibacillus gellani]